MNKEVARSEERVASLQNGSATRNSLLATRYSRSRFLTGAVLYATRYSPLATRYSRSRFLTGAVLLWGLLLGGCQSAPKEIFPAVSPPIVWPGPPDQERIRYVGQLLGQADLGARPKGWAALRQLIAGPDPVVVFSRPSAVAATGETIFVADTGLGVVHRLDLSARAYAVLRGNPEDPLKVPIDLAVVDKGTGTEPERQRAGQPRGTAAGGVGFAGTEPERQRVGQPRGTAAGGALAVVDRARAAIDLFGLDGTYRTTHRFPELAAPVAIAWDATAGEIWLLDAAAHAVFTTRDWRTLTRRFGERGSGPAQFNYPSGFDHHPRLGLAVADAMNFRVQVLGPDGTLQAAFGQKGNAAGDFARPRDVAIDSEEHLYVLDNQFENIQIFDASGRLLMAFGEGGDGPGQFSLPSGITIDARDRIWVADSSNRRVQVFQYLPEQSAHERRGEGE